MLLAGVLLAALACTSTPPPPLLSAPRAPVLGGPQAFQRETELAPSREVLLPDLGITFRVPTHSEVVSSRGDDMEIIHFDIGTEVPVMCQIHAGQMQLANFLLYHPARLSNEPGATNQPRRVAHVGSGAEAGHAFLALHWLYPVQEGSFGVVKQAAANAYGHTVYCHHREPGYEKTFTQVFRTLLSTFFTQHAVEPYYAEIVEIHIGERPIGFESMEMRRLLDGRSRIDYSQSWLLPRGPGALIPTDTHEISFSTEEGDLIQQNSIQVQGGRLAVRLALQEVSPGHWRVSGVYKAKEFGAEFDSEHTLRSLLGASLDMRDELIRRGSRASVTYRTWIPDSNPAGVSHIETHVTGLRDDGFYTGTQTLGSTQAELVLDSDGSVVSAIIPVGPTTMKMRRVFVAGVF
jgi:hypothetical protein